MWGTHDFGCTSEMRGFFAPLRMTNGFLGQEVLGVWWVRRGWGFVGERGADRLGGLRCWFMGA